MSIDALTTSVLHLTSPIAGPDLLSSLNWCGNHINPQAALQISHITAFKLQCEDENKVTHFNNDIWKADRCTTCVCDRGNIICSQIVCDQQIMNPNCKSWETPLNECCPVCTDGDIIGRYTRR
ncbi:Collagen alpha-2(V) chain, partial [Branchiostoma belcheri]